METTRLDYEPQRVQEARSSFTGLLLTDRQNEDVKAVVGVLARRIQERGSFIEPLNDYAHALARTESFNPVKADEVLREQFKILHGKTMNAMREELKQNEDKLFDRASNPAEAEKQKAHEAVMATSEMVQHGTKITFNRALAHHAAPLARELGITDMGAKKLMAETLQEREGRDLYEFGKQLDVQYFQPQIEVEKLQRRQAQKQAPSPQPVLS